MFWLIWSITDYLFNCLLYWHLFLDPPTIRNVTTSSKKSWIGQTVTLKCLSDGVPTPTLSWYKPEGSEINRVTARENKVQVPLRGDQDFGHYKCIAANGLIPSDEKLIKITQISKLMRSVYFDKKKFYIRSAFSFALAHYHCFSCIRSKNQIFLQSIGQSNLFTLYISFDSLTFNTCGYFSRSMGVWKKYMLMLKHRVRDLLFFHLRTICPLSFRHTSYGLIWAFHSHFSPL